MESHNHPSFRKESKEAFLSIENDGAAWFIDRHTEYLESIEKLVLLDSLAGELGTFYQEENSDEARLAYEHGVRIGCVLGYALYGNSLENEKQQRFWDRIETLDALTHSLNTQKGPLSAADAFGETYLQQKLEDAEKATAHLTTVEKKILRQIARSHADGFDEVKGLRLGFGLSIESAFYAEYGQDLSLAYLNIGDGEIWKKTVQLFMTGIDDVEGEESTIEGQKSALSRAVDELNANPFIEVVYRRGMEMILTSGSHYLVSDDKAKRYLFHQINGGGQLRGTFAGFNYGDVPRQKELQAIEKPTSFSDIADVNPFGLYIELRQPVISNAQGSSIQLPPRQRVLIPISYPGQHLFCEQ